MSELSGVARGLIRIHFNKTDGLKSYLKGAGDRNMQISLVKEYGRQHPMFRKLVENAGMNSVSVLNLLTNGK